jgi:hypothetical protein
MNLKIKIIILVAAMGIISYPVMAQKANSVPLAVLTSFTAKYPQANVKKWEMNNGQYLAVFTMGKQHSSASFSSDGNWLSTKTDVRISKLPADIRYTLRNSRYSSYTIDDVKDVQMPSKNMYLLEVDNDSGNKMVYSNVGLVDDELLYFSQHGRLLESKDNN